VIYLAFDALSKKLSGGPKKIGGEGRDEGHAQAPPPAHAEGKEGA
jgi:hypothetical protein